MRKGVHEDGKGFKTGRLQCSGCHGDTDLSGLWEQMEGKDEDTWNALNFPNAGRLSAYHTIFLLKADEQTAEVPEGLTLTVEDIVLFGKLNDAFSVTLNVAILC
ncbi:hypothetical protein [Parablautia intestinalis]|uniref:hypothetical protein n=1 Tax=Parablautia intestinalis TaxID=2320100 RepID=UPI002412BC70|nr:hypothetical protein [Parablautia intestinalis]